MPRLNWVNTMVCWLVRNFVPFYAFVPFVCLSSFFHLADPSLSLFHFGLALSFPSPWTFSFSCFFPSFRSLTARHMTDSRTTQRSRSTSRVVEIPRVILDVVMIVAEQLAIDWGLCFVCCTRRRCVSVIK